MRILLAIFLACVPGLLMAQTVLAPGDCPNGQCPTIGNPGGADGARVLPADDLGAESSAIVRIVNVQGTARTLGSGTLVDVDAERGLILTCAHLFRDAVGALAVTFPDRQSYEARLVKVDASVDLAALVIRAPRVAPIAIADRWPKRGDSLVSCGYGSDGRLRCNRGQALGYVTLLGSEGAETLELTGSARSGDSGGPVLDRHHCLVAVLFGTNGRVVDGTFCGRVRRFLADLCPRLHARRHPPASPPSDLAKNGNAKIAIAAPPAEISKPQVEPATEQAESAPPGPPETTAPEPAPSDSPAAVDKPPRSISPSDSIGAAADSAGAIVEPWISARLTALLMSLGVPGGAAGVAAGAAVWLVMRRGKRRLQEQLDRLANATAERQPDATADERQTVERHHNRYVAYEATALDKAWAAAHAHVGEKYPGAVPYLKIAEGVKEQLLAGNTDPHVS
jgi:Trypsin-like peptidase domain